VLVGLVGCGRWGKYILRDLRTLGCDVAVVARSEASVARARTGEAQAIVETVDRLGNVAGVVVATPTATHAKVVEEILGLGVPVFVEKPLCSDPVAARRLAARAPERLFVMDKWRYHPGIARIAELARDGQLGKVRGLRTIRVDWGTPHQDSDVVWHFAPHDLAIALEVLGEIPMAERVVGHVADGKVLALHGLLSAAGVWHALELSERSPVKERRVELHCDGGIVTLADGWDEHVSVYRPDDSVGFIKERLRADGELPLLAELRAFVDHLRGGPPPKSSAAEGAVIVETIAELRRLAGAR
jgi:predicted dehydrogenase